MLEPEQPDDDFKEEAASLEKAGLQLELSRRGFIQSTGLLSLSLMAALPAAAIGETDGETTTRTVTLKVNGKLSTVPLDPRTSLLDALRERLELTGTKKGCDHGQCGACTVLLDGRRVNSCLTLALAAEGAEITTIEGLAKTTAPKTLDDLHPVQASFLDHDAYQCGYCTPGQICSAVALIDEHNRGTLSIVSFHTGRTERPDMTDDEIRERMSGNICRCGAYPNIVAAVRAVTKGASS